MANPADTTIEFDDVNKDAPPPSYGAAQDDSPPSYDSIFGKVQKAKDESSGNVDFAQRLVFIACCGTLCTIISLACLFTIPIVNLVIGVVYLDDCKMEKYIPIFLVVAGVFGIVKGIIKVIYVCCRKGKDDEEEQKAKPNPVEQIVDCFLFAWFIAGSVWVYSNHKNVKFNDEDDNDYCHEVCYKYAFWLLTISYIFLGLALLCCCGGMIVACCVACKSKQ